MERQYLDLLEEILEHGQREPNRTGIDTFTLPGAMLKFDLREGFPAVTTKKLAWKAVVGELIGFLRGSTSLAEFKALGCNVWDANAAAPAWQNNPACKGPDDLGAIYSKQWRDFSYTWSDPEGVHGHKGLVLVSAKVDQIYAALRELRENPQSRRIIVNAWNPTELNDACLPPCHVLFQLLPRSDGTLHMTMYQRSCDMFLGVPFNIASYALLLSLFAAWSGRTAATLTMFLADAHIYENHVEQVKEQLARVPFAPPRLSMVLSDGQDGRPAGDFPTKASIEDLLRFLEPGDLKLVDYQHHDTIKAPMAV